MFVTGRAALAAVSLVVLAAAGCSSKDGSSPDQGGTISATTMRGALMQASELGPTWDAPTTSADPNTLVSLCGGTATPPALPPGGDTVRAAFADEGDTGAQTLDQVALVYGDDTAAKATQTALRAASESCSASVSVPAAKTADHDEPAYTETVQIQPLQRDSWDGFAVIRHKLYDPAQPGTADTAVVILNSRNVVLVDTYAIYRVGNASAAADFTENWGKLVGTVIGRVG